MEKVHHQPPSPIRLELLPDLGPLRRRRHNLELVPDPDQSALGPLFKVAQKGHEDGEEQEVGDVLEERKLPLRPDDGDGSAESRHIGPRVSDVWGQG